MPLTNMELVAVVRRGIGTRRRSHLKWADGCTGRNCDDTGATTVWPDRTRNEWDFAVAQCVRLWGDSSSSSSSCSQRVRRQRQRPRGRLRDGYHSVSGSCASTTKRHGTAGEKWPGRASGNPVPLIGLRSANARTRTADSATFERTRTRYLLPRVLLPPTRRVQCVLSAKYCASMRRIPYARRRMSIIPGMPGEILLCVIATTDRW